MQTAKRKAVRGITRKVMSLTVPLQKTISPVRCRFVVGTRCSLEKETFRNLTYSMREIEEKYKNVAALMCRRGEKKVIVFNITEVGNKSNPIKILVSAF